MLILLPPSEGKTTPTHGRPLDLDALSFPTLTPTRERVLGSLQRLCAGSPAKARTALGLSLRQDAERERNVEVLQSPAAPAWQIYTGVLYDALEFGSLPKAAQRRGGLSVVIGSALFGLIRITDAIPAYRLSADSALPKLGRPGTVWRDVLPDAITEAAGKGIVVDLRSSSYVSLAPVPTALAERTAVARVLHGGKVVSHHNKATKGRLVRSLLEQAAPRSITDLAGALGESGHHVTLTPPARAGTPWTIDVEVTDL